MAGAYAAATDGDIIIISGGNYAFHAVIAKQISFIGAGYDPRYTLATGRSVVSNYIELAVWLLALL